MATTTYEDVEEVAPIPRGIGWGWYLTSGIVWVFLGLAILTVRPGTIALIGYMVALVVILAGAFELANGLHGAGLEVAARRGRRRLHRRRHAVVPRAVPDLRRPLDPVRLVPRHDGHGGASSMSLAWRVPGSLWGLGRGGGARVHLHRPLGHRLPGPLGLAADPLDRHRGDVPRRSPTSSAPSRSGRCPDGHGREPIERNHRMPATGTRGPRRRRALLPWRSSPAAASRLHRRARRPRARRGGVRPAQDAADAEAADEALDDIDAAARRPVPPVRRAPPPRIGPTSATTSPTWPSTPSRATRCCSSRTSPSCSAAPRTSATTPREVQQSAWTGFADGVQECTTD